MIVVESKGVEVELKDVEPGDVVNILPRGFYLVLSGLKNNQFDPFGVVAMARLSDGLVDYFNKDAKAIVKEGEFVVKS